MNKNVKT